MFRVRKLYTDPAVIDPVEFTDGVNLILGEKDESSNKTNGVGKSLSMEFLNFALLSDKTKSRVSLIPPDIFPPDTEICLDFEIDRKKYTLRRSLENSKEPELIANGEPITFANIDDASKYLRKKLFSQSEDNAPSFRAILGPLMRSERSEFKSIVGCYDTKLRIPDNYEPHLFLFGLDSNVYSSIREANTGIDDLNKGTRKIKESVKLLCQKEISDARPVLNELERQVKEIEQSIDALENVSGYEVVKDDIIRLETSLEKLRGEKLLLSRKLASANIIAKVEKVDAQEIGEFFAILNERLGEVIKKDLEEVYLFKAKIDEFQNQLINEQRSVISEDIANLTREINEIDQQYTEKLKILDQQGNLKNLKQTYAAFKEKVDEASHLRNFIRRFDDLEKQKQEVRTRVETAQLQLQSDIQAAKETLTSFENTILDIHEYIQENKQASFEIKLARNKQVVEIVMRIDDDGSHSVEREKVFIYDIALLLNEHTASNHPGILVHDNIFDVDQDTLSRSIKFLFEKAEFSLQQQYILTLNSDRLESDIRDLIAPAIRAEYTKKNRFLKKQYQEKR